MRTCCSIRSVSAFAARAILALVQPDRFADLVADREDRIERGHRLLEDHRDLGAADAAHRRAVGAREVDPRAVAPREIERPARMRPPPCSTSRMIDSAVTDLPEPDSPTMATVSPEADVERDVAHRVAPFARVETNETDRPSTARAETGDVPGCGSRAAISEGVREDPLPVPVSGATVRRGQTFSGSLALRFISSAGTGLPWPNDSAVRRGPAAQPALARGGG